jgi:SAM-dependent methyltransferase
MSKKVTFSAGFDSSKIRTTMGLWKYFRSNRDTGHHDYHRVFCGSLKILEEFLGKDPSQIRMLEIGCGQRFALTLLYHTMGAKVTGIDTDFVDPFFTPKGMLGIWKHNGFERFAKTLVRHIFFDRSYYSSIAKELGSPLKLDKSLDIRFMNACNLEFPDREFDFIYSCAVFEHIDNVDKAASEAARVLKDDGVISIGIHLFHSLSGGHSLEWAYPESRPSQTIPPWDHLRKNLYPTHVYLNKLRQSEFIAIFEKYFTILDIKEEFEGEKLLTDEILRELPDYSREELLKRGIRVTMKKLNK